MQQFLGMIFNAGVVLFFFSFTIFVHELGHFWVARKLGFKVLEFSIGFGPALWKKTIDGVLWKIAIIPLGGYVKLPQMDPTGASLSDDEKKTPLPVMDPWKRIAVGLAGVTCNMILAFVLAFIVMWVGRPAVDRDYGTKVDYVRTNSVLFVQGLRAGDQVESINGHAVHTWDQVITEGALNPDARLLVRRGDAKVEIQFSTNSAEAAAMVFSLDAGPVSPAIIGDMYTNWPGYLAGLRSGDKLMAVDGVPVLGIGHMISMVTKSEGRTLHVEFERSGERKSLDVTPRYDEDSKAYRIGNYFQHEIVHPSPLAEIRYAGGAVFRLLNKFGSTKSAGRAFDAMGGVPEIFLAFWVYAKAGLIVAISLAVTLNVNLAIMNLLPFMVLDGGHILLALWEIIRRKPASPKFVAVLWQAGAVCLISLMLFLTLRGVYRVHKWTSDASDAQAEAAANTSRAPEGSMHAQDPVAAPP